MTSSRTAKIENVKFCIAIFYFDLMNQKNGYFDFLFV